MSALVKFPGNTGSLTFPGFGGDFTGFDLESSQKVDDATGYSNTPPGGNITSTSAIHLGSGVIAWTLDFNGFCAKSVTPGLAMIGIAPVAFVGTVAANGTYAGNMTLQSLKISPKKDAPMIPFSGRAMNAGDIVEAWTIG